MFSVGFKLFILSFTQFVQVPCFLKPLHTVNAWDALVVWEYQEQTIHNFYADRKHLTSIRVFGLQLELQFRVPHPYPR